VTDALDARRRKGGDEPLRLPRRGSWLKRAAFPAVLGLVAGVFAAILLSRVLDSAITERTRRELVSGLDRAAQEFEPILRSRDAAGGAQAAVGLVSRQAGARVTLIAADGAVLADSDVRHEELSRVENHASRDEVLAARAEGFGFARRTSATTQEPFVYVARRVGPVDAPVGFVRFAVSQNDLSAAEAPFRGTLQRLSFGAGLVVALLVIFIRQRHARELALVQRGVTRAAEGSASDVPEGASEETEEVFAALSRFARLVSQEREGSARAQALARTVFEEVPIGLVVVDRSMTVLSANPAALKVFDFPGSVRPSALIDLVREPAVLRVFERGVTEPESVDPSTVRLHTPSRAERVLEVAVRAVPGNVGGDGTVVVGVFRDVTEREAVELMRRRFVADVSHELRTPIAAIRAAVESLDTEDEKDEDRKRFFGIVSRQAAEMQDLVSDLTDLAQIESGSITLHIEPQPLRRILENVVSDLAPAAALRDVTVVVDVPGPFEVSGDARRLAQVFRNLVDNAIKFSPLGSRVDVLCEMASAGGDARALVHVIDRGIGIPNEEQPRIFQRFYRVDPSRTKTVPGTGLGLAIVKHLLILQGGGIAVDSEPGRGSRFTVTLPVSLKGTPVR